MKLETKKARVHKKKKFFNHNNTDNMVLFLLQLPVLIYTLIFAYIPMYGIIIAFKKFNPRKGIWGSQWVGLENFEFFRRSKEFWEIFGRTVAYNVWFLFIGLVSAVGLAILFYSLSSKRLVKVYSTISILPRFMSAVLLSYLVYAFLNPVSGILNKIIEALGGTSIDWYMNRSRGRL